MLELNDLDRFILDKCVSDPDAFLHYRTNLVREWESECLNGGRNCCDYYHAIYAVERQKEDKEFNMRETIAYLHLQVRNPLDENFCHFYRENEKN